MQLKILIIIMMTIALLGLYLIISKLSINSISKYWLGIFLFIWYFVQSICVINIYELVLVEIGTYVIINIFVLFYVFGFLTNFGGLKININQKLLRGKILEIIDQKSFKIIFIIVAVITTFYFYKYIQFMVDAPLADARKARFYTGFVFKNGIEQILFNTILSIFVNILLLISIISIQQKINKSYRIYLSLLTAVSWNGFGGGRFDLLVLIFMYIFSSLIFFNDSIFIHQNKNLSKNLVLILTASLIAVITTSYRSGGAIDFHIVSSLTIGLEVLFEQIVTYFNGAILAFQHSIAMKEKYYYPGYGMFTLSGIDELLSLSLSFVGLNITPFNYNYTEIMDRNIYIGNGFEFNALYTALYYGYMDFDILGVVAMGYILGFFSSLSINKLYIHQNLGYVIICWIFFLTSMLTPVVLKLTSTDIILILASGFVMTKRLKY